MKKLRLLSLVASVFAACALVLPACTKTNKTSEESTPGPVVDNGTYTYRSAANSLPTSWNSHTYQSNDATTVTGYTTDGLYEFDYNENKDGYKIVPSMATDFPVDVTADFIGQYGIEEGAENRVYKVTLKDNLKFDNGDPITGATFVESMQLLLAPEAANYRADTYFSGNLIIHNAKNYAYHGLTVYEPAYTTLGDDFDWRENEVYFDASNVTAFGDIFGASDMASLAGYKAYFQVGDVNYYDMLAAYAGDNRAVMTEEIFNALKALFSEDAPLSPYWVWADCEIGYFTVSSYTYDDLDFSEVGFFAEGNDLYIVNDNELSGFYLLYSLSTDFFLVHPQTYKDCIKYEAGVYTNSYGTSVATYVGFGPYKLTEYVADNSVKFAKNPHWHGYSSPANAGLYQTTNIEVLQVSDAQTRLNMFLAGDLDAYGLQAEDMDDYQSSPHTYYTDGDSTWFVALNPDMEGLTEAQKAATPLNTDTTEVNKTIITIKEFRQALSFSIDRAAYALALDPLGGTAKALFGNMIISDPENGVAYRTTEEAKDVILEFWGLTDLVGTVYSSKDAAIDSITGYDLAGAKRLFDVAYQKAVEQGLITDTEHFEIQIMIGQPGSGGVAYYNNGYELLKQVWTDAVVGTALEGHLTFKQSPPLGSSNFSQFLKDNEVDVLFGVGWTGSTLDPYGLMEAYVAPNYQYDPGWDTSATYINITLPDPENEGATVTLRASVFAWGAEALAGKDINAVVIDAEGNETSEIRVINAGANADPTLRLKILAAVEGAVLNQYDMIPINLDASAALKGMKITYGTEEYVFGVGRGGIKYMTYNYNDEEWEAFVDTYAVDGQLNYKA